MKYWIHSKTKAIKRYRKKKKITNFINQGKKEKVNCNKINNNNNNTNENKIYTNITTICFYKARACPLLCMREELEGLLQEYL